MNDDRKCKECGSVKCNFCEEYFNPRDKCQVILEGLGSPAGESSYAKQVCVSCFQSIRLALDDFSGDKDGCLTVVDRTLTDD